jgi:peroxiredoxin
MSEQNDAGHTDTAATDVAVKPGASKKTKPAAKKGGVATAKPAAAEKTAPTPATPTGKRALTWPVALSQLIVVVIAASLVFGYVTIAREGEVRRVCAPTCILQPEYHANLSSKEDVSKAPRMAPDFRLKDMLGKDVTLSQFRGNVVVMNFWMKSCAPCIEEFPEFVEMAEMLASRTNVVVLSVSVDEGPADIQDTLKAVLKTPPPFPILFDPDTKIVRGEYGTSQFPETWIIDAEGRIRARFDGIRKWSTGAVIEYIDQVRNGEFCPLEIKFGKRSGAAHKQGVCSQVSGG